MERENTLLLLAGGSGTRMGSNIPKQFIKVQGKMIIERCIDNILKCESIGRIQIVVDVNRLEFTEIMSYCSDITSRCDVEFGYSKPGSSRAESIYNGLCDLKGNNANDCLVLIHDAARPLVSARLLQNCISACKGLDGVMPVLPVKDTMYYKDFNSGAITLLDRKCILLGQSPEAFYLNRYLKCYDGLSRDEMSAISGTSELAIRCGLNVGTIDGEEDNFKITTANDIERYEDILRKKDGQYDI